MNLLITEGKHSSCKNEGEGERGRKKEKERRKERKGKEKKGKEGGVIAAQFVMSASVYHKNVSACVER